MSKNKPPHNPVPPPHPPEAPPPPPEDPALLVVSLIRVNAAVLRECKIGEKVAVRSQLSPIQVTLPSGLHLGEIGAEDEDAVRRRHSSIGNVVAFDINAAQCSIQV